MKTKSLLLIIAFLGCGTLAFSGPAKRIKGSGNVIKETRHLDTFHAIDVGGAFEVELIKSNEEKIIIETDDNIMPYIKTRVSGGELDIDNTEDINNPTELKLTIYYKSIDEIDISGAASLYSADILEASNFEMDCSGASEITLKLDVGSFDADFSGASKMEFEGKVKSAEFDLSGASVLRAYGLEINDLELDASGAATVKVLVIDRISIEASGASSVRYKGDPSIELNGVSGASSVRKG
jgi:hypothetical protein